MVTDQQLDHYRTFGFVVLPAYLDQRDTDALRQELDHALRDGFGAHFHQRPALGGIEGHYLPMMGHRRTPVSLALVEDARFLGAARRLLEGPVLPTYAEGILLFGQAGLHYDDGTGSRGVKFVAYLEPLTAETGALRLMPGSHHPDFAASPTGWQRCNPALDAEGLRRQLGGLPCCVAETLPGDVVAFDWHTWHASIGGTDRRQWTIGYATTHAPSRRPSGCWTSWGASFPRATSPTTTPPIPATTSTWLVAGPEHPERATLTERMRELGMFEIARGR